MSESTLKKKSFDLALQIIESFKSLTDQKEYVLSKQLLRSGTSIGANVREAMNAQSKRDFVHKLAIAQKECDESIYWVELLQVSKWLDEQQCIHLNQELGELLKIIRSSILTVKKRYPNEFKK